MSTPTVSGKLASRTRGQIYDDHMRGNFEPDVMVDIARGRVGSVECPEAR